MVYYNEIDPFCRAWLRALMRAGEIPNGYIDPRPIQQVTGRDLVGYTSHHFFAGIGGWPYALRLAGWPDDRPIWTGSCPCQPFSSARRGRGRRSTLDLWPTWEPLIAAARPRTIAGEQVASKGWFDRACDDLEALGYDIGAAILPACSVGLDHRRDRLYFVARNTNRQSQSVLPLDAKMARVPRRHRHTRELAKAYGLSGRVGSLRGYGNSIVPQVAATFLETVMELID